MTSARHRWGEPARFPHKTERTCCRGCGITKVARLESDGGGSIYWTEFWRDGEQIKGRATPPCEPFQASVLERKCT
ncbi:hypothetical protein FNL56_13330 [Tardiphaga sp. vice304]|uniref:hypothetical protein n=1 Tax=Tardiphaga sp. vice304 TaxID=2592817 RepID=UPI00116512DB|nr:hypothetical protein [Tardiphaga sp. vice304]QDM26982.1 hypothetical protein FNL56_13330 [Tardiphaga sp. vice304]